MIFDARWAHQIKFTVKNRDKEIDLVDTHGCNSARFFQRLGKIPIHVQDLQTIFEPWECISDQHVRSRAKGHEEQSYGCSPRPTEYVRSFVKVQREMAH